MTHEVSSQNPIRLHIGGMEPRTGWKILNVQPGPHVDYIGSCTDLEQFPNNSVREIYASHVLEHLSYKGELQKTISEAHRILTPNGTFKISVPDFEVLCRIFLHPSLNIEQRFHIMRMVFGGQEDEFDFHKIGLTWEFLCNFLRQSTFANIRKVKEFGIFKDCSSLRINDTLISLNIEATKGPDAQAT